MTARINHPTGRSTRKPGVPGELTVAASAVAALLEFAVSKGARRGSLLERSGIDPAELAERDNRVAFGKYVALMRAGQELCRDPALALHFGESVDVAEIAITHSVGGVTTFADAMVQANRYSRLGVEVETVDGGDRFRLLKLGGGLWLADFRSHPNEFPELTESAFVRMVASARRAGGERAVFTALQVTHAEPPYRAEYDRIFRCPITFGSDRNAIQLDEALVASFRAPPASRYVSGVLRDHAEALLTRLDASKTLRGRLEHLLQQRLTNGKFGVEAIAAELGLSRQTLFRKLKAEGVTFAEILDAVRHRTALHYLDGGKLSVKETARMVGFSDPSAFSRAFKRWAGIRPSEYAARRE